MSVADVYQWFTLFCLRTAACQETRSSALDDLKVDLSVVLGRNRMPVHMLLRMGRGAVIELESTETDMVEILANDHPIARGQIIVTGTRSPSR